MEGLEHLIQETIEEKEKLFSQRKSYTKLREVSDRYDSWVKAGIIEEKGYELLSPSDWHLLDRMGAASGLFELEMRIGNGGKMVL